MSIVYHTIEGHKSSYRMHKRSIVDEHNNGDFRVVSDEIPGQHELERGELNDDVKTLAAKGDSWAQNNLGVIYENGYGDVQQNFTESAHWYRKSAEQGFAVAQHNLGTLYEQGKGVAKELSTAFALYSKAANQDYPPSQYNLGTFYALGWGVSKDLEASLRWFCAAGRRDFEDAAEMVLLVQKEIFKSMHYYNHYSMTESENSLLAPAEREVQIAIGDQDFFTQFDLGNIQSAAEHGDAKAQCHLAIILFSEGKSTEAAIWYRRAAQLGNAQAQFNLGVMLQNGDGVRQDYVEALQWYEKAAHQGYLNAIYNLAYMRENGFGCARNLVAAFQLYKEAASRNEPDSQCKVAQLLLNRELQAKVGVAYRNEGWDFVPADHAEARRLLKEASKHIHKSSNLTLALLGWDDWPPLQELASRHVEKMTQTFANMGGSFLDYASERWGGLFDMNLWNLTEAEARRLHEKAISSGNVESASFVESGSLGRVVLVTIVASNDLQVLLRSFPNEDYCQFYRSERRRFRTINDWESRDFVHWIFLWDEDNFGLHLLYEFSPKAKLNLIGRQIQQMQEKGEPEPYNVQLPPRIMPESLVSTKTFQTVTEELDIEEKELCNSARNADRGAARVHAKSGEAPRTDDIIDL